MSCYGAEPWDSAYPTSTRVTDSASWSCFPRSYPHALSVCKKSVGLGLRPPRRRHSLYRSLFSVVLISNLEALSFSHYVCKMPKALLKCQLYYFFSDFYSLLCSAHALVLRNRFIHLKELLCSHRILRGRGCIMLALKSKSAGNEPGVVRTWQFQHS